MAAIMLNYFKVWKTLLSWLKETNETVVNYVKVLHFTDPTIHEIL